MPLEWRTIISFNTNAHRVSVSHSAHYMSDFNMSQVLCRWHNLCILWKPFAKSFVFITFAKVMDLICNQLSLSGRGRELFRMSSLKESVSVAVMVSRCLLKFCCCCLTVLTLLSVPEWLAHLRLNFVLNVVLPPPEQRPWQCTTVGSWCLCWRRLEQLVPPALQLRLCRQHSARLVVTCKCCATNVVVVK